MQKCRVYLNHQWVNGVVVQKVDGGWWVDFPGRPSTLSAADQVQLFMPADYAIEAMTPDAMRETLTNIVAALIWGRPRHRMDARHHRRSRPRSRPGWAQARVAEGIEPEEPNVKQPLWNNT